MERNIAACDKHRERRLCNHGTLSLEAERFDPKVITYLQEVGYKLDLREPFSFYHGAIHAVLKPQTGGDFQGVAEIRRDGTAAGP